MKYKTLITCGGGLQGKSLIDLLKSSSNYTQIYLCDINKENINKYECDFFYPSPPASEYDEYKHFIYNLIEKHKLTHIIPATTIDINLLSEIKNYAYKTWNTNIIVPEYNVLNSLLNKKKTIDFFQQIKLPTVQTYNINEINKNNFVSLIAKPINGSGSKGIKIIKTYHELQNFIETHPIQDYLLCKLINEFEEYSIDFTVNFDGHVSEFVFRKREFTSMGVALISIIDLSIKPLLDNHLTKLKKTFSHPSYSGIYNLQILKDTNNNIYFNDLNPRVGTSSVASLYSEYNIINNIFSIKSNPKRLRLKNNIKVIRTLKTYTLSEKIDIENIILDLDGTIINTLDFTIKRCLYIYKKFSLDRYITKKNYILFIFEIIYKNQLNYLIDLISKQFNIQKKIILEEYINYLPKVEVYPDASRFLNYCKERNFNLILITVANNTKTHKHKVIPLKEYLNNIYFVKSKYDIFTKNNEFENIFNKLNLNPSKTISVGDNFIQDIIPSIECKTKMSFYIKRTSNYLPNIDYSPYFRYLNHRITEINSLDEIIKYLK